MSVGFPIVVVVVVVAAVLFVRRREPEGRARLLRRAGFTLMALFSVFFALFVAGETFTDPGGWVALGLVASWAVPLAALVALAWFRPGWAVRVLGVLTAAVVGVSIWAAVDRAGWNAFEDRNGPIRTIVVFAVAAVVAVLGLKRTAIAGATLLVLGIVPVALSSAGNNLGTTGMFLASSPPVVTGVLYLLSAGMKGRPGRDAGLRPAPSAT